MTFHKIKVMVARRRNRNSPGYKRRRKAYIRRRRANPMYRRKRALKRSFRHIGRKVGLGAPNPAVCPKVKYCTMEWRGIFPVQVITGDYYSGSTVSDYAYRANSPYDPLSSNVGHYNVSASWYNWYKNIYNFYEVTKSSCTIKLKQVRDGDDVSTDPIRFGCMLDDDGSVSYTQWSDIINDPSVVHSVFHPNTNGDAVAKIRHTFHSLSWFKGVQSTNRAAFGANPSKVIWFLFFYQVESGGVPHADISLNLDVYIRFRVRLTEPKDQSLYSGATFKVQG